MKEREIYIYREREREREREEGEGERGERWGMKRVRTDPKVSLVSFINIH